MKNWIRTAAVVLALAVVGHESSAMAQASAPEPRRAIADPDRFYSGEWREIARNPMSITDGCVAGLTVFSRTADGALYDRDSCRVGSPIDGHEKVFAGPARILDPPGNAKFRTDYRVFGLFHLSRTYFVLDNGEDEGGWFIVSTPDFKNLSIFTRRPHPGQGLIDHLVAESRQMGFAGRLEFPAQP